MEDPSHREGITGARKRRFIRALLEDLRALERLIAEGRLERGVRRLGAEQELFLVDEQQQPASCALEVLGRLDHPQFNTELGLYNLELNLKPRVLEAGALFAIESELNELLDRARRAAAEEGARLALCGILPTLDESHLTLEHMTPAVRYRELNRASSALKGGAFRTRIRGLDELQLSCESVMLEASNASFQVHFQVGPQEFANLYNLAQVVTGPLLAAAANSPVMLGQRLWRETRIVLLQQCLDLRGVLHPRRTGQSRVSFGDRWVDSSVLEIFQDDVARHRVLVGTPERAGSLERIERGEVPALEALCLHNSTVYRWNRPCYGICEGQPHLRIENRVLPAGPTVLDEVANAAFFHGLMTGLDRELGDVTRHLAFEDAHHNFVAAARDGVTANLRWLGGESIVAQRLIPEQLLPLARAGLAAKGLPRNEVDRYLDVIERRVTSGRTGAQWALDSLRAMHGITRPTVRLSVLTEAIVRGGESGEPVHTWELASAQDMRQPEAVPHTAGQVMTTDIFTLSPDDPLDLAANVMDWERIRHVPVEDEGGCLVGILSHRVLLHQLASGAHGQNRDGATVADCMSTELVTVGPATSLLEAMELMRHHGIGCLPVVDGADLVGILSESDLMGLASHLLVRHLQAAEAE